MYLWRNTPDYEMLSRVFRKTNRYEIKYLSDSVATIRVILRNPELCDGFKKILNK